MLTHSPDNYWLLAKGQINHVAPSGGEFNSLAAELYGDARLVQGIRELYNLWRLSEQTAHVAGAMAELGVYRGGTAKLLATRAAGRKLYLFDTFSGIPQGSPGLDAHLEGDLAATSLASVQSYLEKWRDAICFVPGRFPESVGEVESLSSETFSFVHLDADLYESALAGLRYFYPRLSSGGMIVSHDYRSRSCPGVSRAFAEFMCDKPEPILELWDSQCLIIKR